MKHCQLSLFIVIFSSITPLYANGENSVDDLHAKPAVLVYPINISTQPKFYLSIHIPDGFRCLQTAAELSTPGNIIAEFVPQGDDDYEWTQIITGITIKNSHISAEDLIKYMQKKFIERASAVTIVDSTTEEHSDYQQACTTIDYSNKKRHEIVYMCYYCGPNNCAGIQNAMLWPTGTQTTIQEMTAKLKPIIDNNVDVITVSHESKTP